MVYSGKSHQNGDSMGILEEIIGMLGDFMALFLIDFSRDWGWRGFHGGSPSDHL